MFLIPRDGAHHPLCRALAFDQNDHVIGVARKAVSPLFQFQIELIQQDVCQPQQRRTPTRRDLTFSRCISNTQMSAVIHASDIDRWLRTMHSKGKGPITT